MEQTLVYLTLIGIVLLIGLIMSIIAKMLKVSNVLFLIISGIILGRLNARSGNIFSFDTSFLIGISLLALVMIVFDGSSRFKWKEFDTLSLKVLKLIIIFLALNMVFLSIVTYYVMGLDSIILAVIFAVVMSGTDPATVMALFKTRVNKIVEILKMEAILNTALVILIPFIIIDSLAMEKNIISGFIGYGMPFLQQIATGIGTGVVLGVIVFKLMKKFYSEELSPLAIAATAILGYILAENMGGNGVLAVTTLGVMFGNMYLKEKGSLKEFSLIFSNALEIFVFILVGFIIHVSFSIEFILKSLVIFGALLIIRYAAILISFKKDSKITLKNKAFMTLNAPKGIAVAVLALTFSIRNIPGMLPVLDLIIMIMIYSIILSTIVGKLSKYFIDIYIEKENEKCLVK